MIIARLLYMLVIKEGRYHEWLGLSLEAGLTQRVGHSGDAVVKLAIGPKLAHIAAVAHCIDYFICHTSECLRDLLARMSPLQADD
jgi:hypothetical protein